MGLVAGDIPVYVGPNWSYEPPPLGPTNFGAIIYRPGSVSAGDVVATWPEVQTFITKADGKCIVYVDDSMTSPAPVPGATGITQCFGRVELRPWSNDPETQTVLQIQAGATLTDLYAVRGRLEIQCNPSAAVTPSLDWTLNANGGSLLLTGNAILSNVPTAGASAVNIASPKTVALLLETASIVIGNPDHPIFNIADGAALVVQAFDGSSIENGYAIGNGSVSLFYDMATASNFFVPGTPPQVTIGSLYLTKNLDDVITEQTFTTSTINNNIFQSGPLTGIRPVTFKGVGGGGGGGGGSGGSATNAGTGGAAGGAAAYQEITVDVDFSHSINVVVDPGGPGGAGGSGGGGTGETGADGGPTYVLDTTTNIVLCCFLGASGGQGSQTSGGGPIAISSPGSNIQGQQVVSGTGFVGAGGSGGTSGTNGSPGVANAVSIGATITASDTFPFWLPGAGGTSTSPTTDGGGGGGGGQGVYGNGGNGGNCNSGVTTAGGTPLPGSGGGGGGGAGGASSPVTPGSGSSGGNGGSGQITSSYRP